ncbi:MAG: hypothetical protein ACKVE4_12385 [Dissulfuribacterales bacterium]|nr:hypothetical protein [Deltaproteobacteria bacterium]
MKQLMFTLLIFFCGLFGETAAAPSIVGSLDIPWASGVYVSGSHAYVAGLGIQKVDISNPQNPTIVDIVFQIINFKINYAGKSPF